MIRFVSLGFSYRTSLQGAEGKHSEHDRQDDCYAFDFRAGLHPICLVLGMKANDRVKHISHTRTGAWMRPHRWSRCKVRQLRYEAAC